MSTMPLNPVIDRVTRRITERSERTRAVYLHSVAAQRRDGTQREVVASMQTRTELYEAIDYHRYEEKLDQLFARGKPGG